MKASCLKIISSSPTGGLNEDDLNQLEQLLEGRAKNR
jgi:hypothetical protein